MELYARCCVKTLGEGFCYLRFRVIEIGSRASVGRFLNPREKSGERHVVSGRSIYFVEKLDTVTVALTVAPPAKPLWVRTIMI